MSAPRVSHCPRCPGMPLRSLRTQHGTLGLCPRCMGHWVTRQAGDFLAPLIARVARQILTNTEEGRCARGAHTLTPGQEHCAECPKPKLRCPACTSRLVPLEVHEQTVDVCTRCPGLWLDANELAALRSTQPRQLPERPPTQGDITFYPPEEPRSWGASVGEAVGSSLVEGAIYLLVEALFSLF